MLTEKLVQYHSLLGHSQDCLSTKEVRFCYSVYSPCWDKPRLPYFIERILLDYFKFLLSEDIGEYFISHVVPTGTYPVKK